MSRVSMHSDIDIAIMFVRPSVRHDPVSTRLNLFFSMAAKSFSFSNTKHLCEILTGTLPTRLLNTHNRWCTVYKFRDFGPIFGYVWETVPR